MCHTDLLFEIEANKLGVHPRNFLHIFRGNKSYQIVLEVIRMIRKRNTILKNNTLDSINGACTCSVQKFSAYVSRMLIDVYNKLIEAVIQFCLPKIAGCMSAKHLLTFSVLNSNSISRGNVHFAPF